VAARVRRILDGKRKLSLRLGIVGVAVVLAVGLVLIPQGRLASQSAQTPAVAVSLPPSPWQATLPNGITVELVGISYHPSEGKQWWRPDGSPMREAPYDMIRPGMRGEVEREIAVRLGGDETEDLSTTWGLEPSPGWSPDDSPMRGGRPVPGMRALSTAFKAGQRSVTVRVGVAAGEWKALARNGQPSGGSAVVGSDYRVILPGLSGEGGRSTAVTYAFALEGDKAKMAWRLVAVDFSGGLHVASNSGDVAGGLGLQQSRFEGLAPKRIQELRFEVRPYDWVEFRNVSLEPGHRTDVEVVVEPAAGERTQPEKNSSARGFGPVMEMFLADDDSGRDCFIDFDSGRTFSPPPQVAQMLAAHRTWFARLGSPPGYMEVNAWIRDNGIDAVADVQGYGGGRGLFYFDFTFTERLLGSRSWESLTVADIMNRVRGDEGRAAVAAGPSQRFSDGYVIQGEGAGHAYVFRTREDGTGILQIAGLSQHPPGVSIRYKMVQQAGRLDGGTGRQSIVAPDVQEEPRWAMAERERFQPTADKVLSLLGQGWETEVKRITSLHGWEGRINGFAMEFRNSSLRVQASDRPAAFRLSVTNWASPVPLEDASEREDTDFPLGASEHNRWYVSPGTFGRVYPERYRATIASVREVFAIPEPVGGIQCRIEGMSDEMIMAGQPLGIPGGLGGSTGISVRCINVSMETRDITDTRDGLREDLIVRNETGERLPYAGERRPRQVREHSLRPWGEISTKLHSPSYDLSKPGHYTVQVPYRFGPGENDVALSQLVSVLVVPRDFLVFHMRRPAGSVPTAVGDALPVDLELLHRTGPPVQLTDLTVHLTARNTDPWAIICTSAPLAWAGMDGATLRAGRLGRVRGTDMKLSTQPWRARQDLAALGWDSITSSPMGTSSIWKYAKPGETWQVSAQLDGKAEGKHFRLTSETMEFTVAPSEAPEPSDGTSSKQSP